jgi:uncharacterized protein involved in outer membrane biogenesis
MGYGPAATIAARRKTGAAANLVRPQRRLVAQEGAMPFLRGQEAGCPPAPRRFRALRLVLGAIAVPPLIWAAVILLVPTECARLKIIDGLSQSTGRAVKLAAVRLGVFGGARLEGLEIGEKTAPSDPWLKADRVAINISLLQLLSGRLAPSEVRADGLALRVYRRADGSLEFGDLFRASSKPLKASIQAEDDSDSREVAFHVSGARISIIDAPSDTHIQLLGVESQGTWQRKMVALSMMRGHLNGGPFELAATLDRNPQAPAFEGQLHAKGVGLGFGMKALSYLAPVLADAPASVDGRLELDLFLKGQIRSRDTLIRSLKGQGHIALEPIKLDGSEFVTELVRVARIPVHDRVGSVRSDFEIGDGRVSSRNLTLKIARAPVVLAGWTAFDGRLDYRLKTEQLTDRISKETHGLLDDLPFDLNELSTLRVRGRLDRLDWTLADVSLNARSDQDRQNIEDRFRQIGKQLKDRLRR